MKRKTSALALHPPIEPMLAKLSDELPRGDFLYEPKWDGFRALIFRRGDDLYIQSRDARPLDRYFPDLHEKLKKRLRRQCVLDGEIVIATSSGLDFDALQLRLHPAASRVEKLAKDKPASFVAFDVLAVGSRNLMKAPQGARREELERLLDGLGSPLYLTPMTRAHGVAVDWLQRFEGARLDGVIAKPESAVYLPGKRAMIKVKHVRAADCVVAGFRWYKTGEDAVGSLLLGLYDDRGVLQHVGVTSAFAMTMRRRLARELAPLRRNAMKDHPWRERRGAARESHRVPGGQAAGVRGRTCHGNPCAWSVSARSSTTTCRGIDFATQPSFCVGDLTSGRGTAAMISSKLPSPTSLSASSRPDLGIGTLMAGTH